MIVSATAWKCNTVPFPSEKHSWVARETSIAGTVIVQCHQLLASGMHSIWALLLSTKMSEKNPTKIEQLLRILFSEWKFIDINAIFCYKSQVRFSCARSRTPEGRYLAVESCSWSSSSTCAICWEQLSLVLLLAQGAADPALLVWQQAIFDNEVVPLLLTIIDAK